MNELLNLLPQKKDSDAVFRAASLIASAGLDLARDYKQLSGLRLTPAGLQSPDGSPIRLDEISAQLDSAINKFDQANNLLKQVNPNSLPSAYREKLVLAQNNFDNIQKSFHSLRDVLNLGTDLLNGNRHVLVMLENNNELRPTGGFMGTYGDITVNNAAVTSLRVSSIYDLDGQLREKIRPPFPLFAVNNRWFLRDSNWFASWPQSAQKISNFYELEGGETPDDIIAITPRLVQDLLAITGPITLPRYNVTLTSDNFVEMTQVESSVEYSKIDNRPKQILADLVPVLLKQVGSLPKDRWPAVLQALQDNLNQKQIVLYSRDSETEQLIQSFDWGGDFQATDRDFLSVNSSNLNGSKTDLYIHQDIALKTTIGSDGSVTDKLTLTKTNTMPDLPGTSNTSFIRIFVPLGSQLISNSGFDYNTTTPQATPGEKIDPDVAAWEKSIVTDLVSGTSIGQEAGRTFFGNWLTVGGGETKTVSLTYRLPFSLNPIDRYSLMLQKQIGALPANMSYEVDFSGRRLLWESFSPDSTDADNFRINFKFDKDILLGVVLERR